LFLRDAGYTGYTFDTKYRIIEKANTPIILLFSVFGSIFAVFSKRREHKIMLGLYSFAILTYFLPEWYMVRVIHSVLSPSMAFIIAHAVLSIAEMTSKRSAFNKTMMLTLLLMILIPSGLYSVMETYSFIKPNYEYFTEMKRYEWDVGFWLRENTRETERIISDYRTMLNLNPLAQKIWLTPIGMYGQSLDWNAVYNSNGTNLLKYIKDEIFQAPSSEHAYKAIIALKRVIPWHESYYLDYCGINETDFEFLVVITPRTWQWIMQEGYEDVHTINYKNVPIDYLKIFKDSRYFEEIYSYNNEVYVFKVKPHESQS